MRVAPENLVLAGAEGRNTVKDRRLYVLWLRLFALFALSVAGLVLALSGRWLLALGTVVLALVVWRQVVRHE